MRPTTAVLSISLAVLTSALYAQSFTSLHGTVTDPSGNAVPSVALELTSSQTAAKRSALSDQGGAFTFDQVTPGTYRLTGKAPGFSVATVDGLQLVVNTPLTVALKLELGSVNQTVSVNAAAEQVNTEDASLGTAVTTQSITELPLDARNPAQLLALQPGVTYFGDGSDYGRATTGPISIQDRLNGSVNGSKPDQNNITLDGMDVNDQNTRSAFESVLRVTLDSVQEFRTTTLNPIADQGRGSGAQIALITKSGTNSYHGSLYEYNRNTITEANSFFNNSEGLARPALNRNVYGASLGAPILKDRLFFFVNYEGRRDASASSATRTVPTALFRQGIIQYLNTSGGVSTMTPAQLKAVDPAGIGVDPAVLQTLNAYPMPNDSTVGDGYNTAGYRFEAATPLRWNTYIARLDYNVDSSGKNTLFWRGNLQNDNIQGVPQFPGQAASSVTLDNSKGYATGWTSILSPTLVSTFRYGYTRAGLETTGVQDQPYVSLRDISTLSATTTDLARIIPVHQFSEDLSWNKRNHEIKFGGTVRLIHNLSRDYSKAYPNGSVTDGYLAGVGAQLEPSNINSDFFSSFRSAAVDLVGPVAFTDVTYNYTTSGSLLPFGEPIKRDFASNEYEFYVNDNWHVKSNFVVNLGLRYLLSPAIHEVNGYQVSPNINLSDWFNDRVALAAAGQSQAGAPVISYVLANSPGGQPLYNTPKKNFSPRVGLAYSPEARSGLSKFFFGGPGKSSIRAGFGIYYDLFGESLARVFDADAPGLSSEYQSPSTADLATTPRYTGYNSLPVSQLTPAPAGGFPYTPPVNPATGFAISNSIDQNLKQPYTMNINFTLSREFKGVVVEGSYVGRLGRRELAVTDLATPTNLKDPASGQTYWQAINILMAQARANVPVSQVKPVPFFQDLYPNLAGNGLTATQSMYANNTLFYPTDSLSNLLFLDQLCSPCSPVVGPFAMLNEQYADAFAYRSIGKSYYHAMQWTIRKRFSNGLTFDFNYTWSKSIDYTSNAESDFNTGDGAIIFNPFDTALNKGVSDFDIPQSFSGHAVYQLPIGRGAKFLGNSNRIVDAFLGGWQVSGLYNITSGLPRSVLNTNSWSINWDDSTFADQVGYVPTGGSTRNAPGIDGVGGPNIFADPTIARSGFDYSYAGQVGERNGVRGDGLMSIDMSLSKRFVMPYNEKHSVQFRWEVFNVPNAVRFDISTASLDVSNTGTFGKYTSLLEQPREMQFAIRYEF
ncbi:MAG TPA: carboxypeptidase-like regulatory domain-containing protein [Bryobacteraceae bacterium]|nr:carboxypeptidase-like regulatory domain-containing protein [Bryobacteraceae bacterium]